MSSPYKDVMLEQIKKKQGQSGYVYARLACLSPEDGAAAVRELIADGAIYKHPIGGLLYISTNQNKPKEETSAPQQKTKRAGTRNIPLRELNEHVIPDQAPTPFVEQPQKESEQEPVEVKAEPMPEQAEPVAESPAKPEPEAAAKKPFVPRASSRKTVPSPDEIYDYIKENGPQPAYTIAAHFGFRSQAFNHILLAMCHASRIFRKERIIDRKFIYSIDENFDPNIEHLASLASNSPAPGTPEFQELCYKVIAAISARGGAATAQQVTEYFDYKYPYNDINFILGHLNQRSRVSKQQGNAPSAATVWVLAKRVTAADATVLYSDICEAIREAGHSLTTNQLAEITGKTPTRISTSANNYVKSGKLVKNVKDSVTYWDLPDTSAETALSEIEAFLKPKLNIEKPDPQWLPVINKLATGIGGNAGAMLSDVASYLDNILKME